jgi:hypothetical protein
VHVQFSETKRGKKVMLDIQKEKKKREKEHVLM